MKLYGKSLLFKRGLTLNIYLTLRCNLMCDFCCVKANRVKCDESTLEQWQEFFRRFPEPVRELSVSGGETTLVDYYPELCNWLLDEGYHVSLATNLHKVKLNRDWPLLRIQRHYRFQVSATCHTEPEPFTAAVKSLRALDYRVNVREVGTRMIPGSAYLKEQSQDELYFEKAGLNIAPDRSIHINAWHMVKNLERRNGYVVLNGSFDFSARDGIGENMEKRG